MSAFSLLSACGGNNDTGYTICGLVLQNNGADDLTIDADGGFSFATPIHFGSSYVVTIVAQPGEQSCSLINGSGTVRGDITDIQIGCPYPVPVLSVTSGGPKLLSFSWTDLYWLNRMLLPDQVGTVGDSHTRFSLVISFPAGSGLVTFGAVLG